MFLKLSAVLLTAGLALLAPAPVARGQSAVAVPAGDATSASHAKGREAGKAGKVRLKIDDGSPNVVIGVSDAQRSKSFPAVVVNRFTPDANRLPLRLDTVLVLFPETCQAGDTGLRAGMTFEAVVYLDPSGSGDPANATLVARQEFAIDPDDDRFQKVRLDEPVTVVSGDVWVGYFTTVSLSDDRFLYHAAVDTNRPQGRSWLFYNRVDDSFTGDVLSAADFRRRLEDEGIAGNWMIRARGTEVSTSRRVEF